MKVVLQRVKNASVKVDEKVKGSIRNGLLLLVGIHKKDTEEKIQWMCKKILKLRVFDDEEGKMNRSVLDVEGELLVVSQFTLYGDVSKGNRPSYIEAAGPQKAEELYDKMVHYLKEKTNHNVQTGQFGAHMDVYLLNDGPVTIVLER